jgi:predicted hotdog family 3-hydroxylacyl-ACP dehydratase
MLAVATKMGVIKVMDVRGTEVVMRSTPYRFTLGVPVHVSVNADGSAVAIQCLVSTEEAELTAKETALKVQKENEKLQVWGKEGRGGR